MIGNKSLYLVLAFVDRTCESPGVGNGVVWPRPDPDV